MQLHKLVTLGDGGVGKTALIIQLCLQHFVETYDPTIEDSYRKQVCIDNASCMLEVLDTAGQEEYSALRDQWIQDGEAFLLVYSISSRSSFSRIKEFHNEILRVQASTGCEPSPICLVGTKSDRVTEREVATTEGFQLALGLGVDYFVECSAKNCINVEKAFYDLVRILRVQGGSSRRWYETRQSLFGSQLIIPPDEKNSIQGRDRLARCLLHAARTNNVKEAVEFLDAGVDVNAQPTLSGSALHATAAFGYLSLTSVLLKRGAGVNATAAYQSGISPLQEAAAGGHIEVLKLLLRQGARLNQESALRGTALHAAASRGRTQVVEYLLKQGADATQRSGPYEFALHAGAWYGSKDVVSALLNGGADILAVNEDGCTALHMAAFAGNVEVTQILLGRGARLKVNAVSERFGTALDAADENGHFDTVKILLEAGALKHFRGREGNHRHGKPTILDPNQRGPSKVAMLPSETDAHLQDLDDPLQGSLVTPTSPIAIHENKPAVQSIGFTKLSNPANAKVDIVFVHGLQGHPEKTWSHRTESTNPRSSIWLRLLHGRSKKQEVNDGAVYWPYEFLCSHPDFAASRILTWGYDTKVTREFFGTTDSENISRHGNNLMVMLQQERKSDPTRPLIFVAHSLGGIVVKTALNASKQSTHQPNNMGIYSSTIGIIFMGTPHGGCGVANWALIASNFRKISMQGASTRVLKGLKPNNELLENLRKCFLQMLEDGHFSIHSFYETLPMVGVHGLNGLVVPYESALVGHARKETALGIHGNHASICKFKATSDPGYQAVFGALQDYVRAAVPEPEVFPLVEDES